MESGQVWIAYQPKLDIRSGRIFGVEALVRWDHPQRGAIGTDQFIPLLEAHGRARDLTLHVLSRALEDAAGWRASGRDLNISIDDYGTGQSSLAYLQTLPATELKIDKSFVATIVSDSRNAIMVRSTIAMAHELGMTVVAEGVEEANCLRLLAEMGCDTAQGWHVGRPMDATRLIEGLAVGERVAA